MRLTIRHTTSYHFDAPQPYGLQQLRKTPRGHRGQKVLSWETEVEGGRKELSYEDQHRNTVELIGFEPDIKELVVTSQGEVEIEDTAGIVGPHLGFAPLWLYQRDTAMTKPGKHCREIMAGVDEGDDVPRLHALSSAIREAVTYRTGQSETGWTAENAAEAGVGVCQDHTHIFLACARAMGYPARYVSGYLMMNDRVDQDAMHAWAEAHVDGVGWVGFDISNGISPDTRYVRVALGMDYAEAAPISGTRFGGRGESMTVALEVAQQ